VNAQKIYRTFRSHVLDLAATHDLPAEQALLALARAASRCPPNLAHFQTAQYVRAQIDEWIVDSQQSGRGLRETG
jgi:hypothetical protein